MRKLWIGILIGIGLAIAPSVHAANYTYYRAITTTSTDSVASGTNANFPYLISGTYTWLESTSTAGGAGRIQNLVSAPNGSQEPADLIFVTSTPSASGSLWSCGTSLNFETESYTSSTGVIVDWVKVPSVSTGTVIYACYGNSSVTTDQSHPSSTWNSNFAAVYHLAGGTGSADLTDSSANANTLGAATPSGVAGEVDGGASLSATSVDHLNPVGISTGNIDISESSWVKLGSNTNMYIAGYGANSANGSRIGLWYDGTQLAIENENAALDYAWTYDTAWHYLVATHPAGGNVSSQILYLDGVALVPTSTTAGGTALNLANDMYIIGDIPGARGSIPLTATVDESHLLSTVLTPSWILTEYNNQNSPSTFYSVGSEQSITNPSPSLFTNKFLFVKGFLKI